MPINALDVESKVSLGTFICTAPSEVIGISDFKLLAEKVITLSPSINLTTAKVSESLNVLVVVFVVVEVPRDNGWFNRLYVTLIVILSVPVVV